MYLVGALCMRAAYLTVSWPEEIRKITRQTIKADGLEMVVGKRKKGHARRSKLIE